MDLFDRKAQYLPHTLLRFEVQVSEHCNLNCCNCVHYSPLAKPEFLDIEEYERDIKRLSELFCGEVEWIRLMGGEPLLNPQLLDIMSMTRRYFPYGHIRIVSNGILLSEQTEAFFDACRRDRIEIWVTKYPIKLDYEQMAKKIASENIVFGMYGVGYERKPTMWRFPIDVRGDFDPDWNFYHCGAANNCLTLRHGKLYTCATSAHSHHLKDYYGLNIPCSERDGTDIYKVKNADELMGRMVRPIPFCRYCDYSNKEDYEDDWSVSCKNRYEWISFRFTEEDIHFLKNKEVYVYGAGNWGKKTIEKLQKKELKYEG